MAIWFINLKRIVGKPKFSDQLKKKNVMKEWDTTWISCAVCVPGCEPNHGNSYCFLFNCTMVDKDLRLMTALTLNFNPLLGACCSSLAWPKVAQLEVFFRSDYL